MSQSKPSYGAEAPKGTARKHRQRANTSQNQSDEAEPEPACPSRSVGHSVEKREWREIAYRERMIGSYRPCKWPECFGGCPPDANEIESVVLSCRHSTAYHRPRDDDTEPAESRSGNTRIETVPVSQDATRESIDTIADLRDGDGVTWEGQATPMLVIGPTEDPAGVVNLVGPGGGEYHIEGRPGYPRPYYVRGAGCRHEIRRVPAATQPKTV